MNLLWSAIPAVAAVALSDVTGHVFLVFVVVIASNMLGYAEGRLRAE